MKLVMFGLIGLGIEVVYSALVDAWQYRHNPVAKQLKGYSSVLYAPFYALTPLLVPLLNPDLPWWARATFYTVVILTLELIANATLKLVLGRAPSEQHYRGAFTWKGLVDVSKFPWWMGGSLFLEYLVRSSCGLSCF